MMIYGEAFRERIYNLICGNYNVEECPIPESSVVTDEFAEGSYCSLAYSRMLAAYSRICLCLGVEEWNDSDVEVINELLDVGRYTSLKMFDYGVMFGRKIPAMDCNSRGNLV